MARDSKGRFGQHAPHKPTAKKKRRTRARGVFAGITIGLLFLRIGSSTVKFVRAVGFLGSNVPEAIQRGLMSFMGLFR